MTSKFNSLLNSLGAGFNLKDTAKGFLRPKGQLGDWQHAARTFTDDNFRLAPKAKFLYHVYFDINASALRDTSLKDRHQFEIGLLVKSVDLPKFTFRTNTVNQYNRKKVVQLTHEYQPINFKFHDDRAHIINKLWQNYYSYYYSDPSVARSQFYTRNATKGPDEIRVSYGFDNNSSIPFFNKIVLYQLNKKEYNSYTLINPLITLFNHDTPNSAEQNGGTAECSMTIAYESVAYDTGAISGDNVIGFATDHYDKLPSPLSPLGGGTSTLFGTGGILNGISSVADNLSKGNYLSAGIAAFNTYENSKGLTTAGVRQEGTNLLGGLAAVGVGMAISGIKDTVFPSKKPNNSTRATQTGIGGMG